MGEQVRRFPLSGLRAFDGLVLFAKLLVQGGGNIVCRNFHWESPGFPKECFYDSRSKRGRVLMHAKVDNSRYAIQLKRFNPIF